MAGEDNFKGKNSRFNLHEVALERYKMLKKEADKIVDLLELLRFWRQEKTEWKRNIAFNWQWINTSGEDWAGYELLIDAELLAIADEIHAQTDSNKQEPVNDEDILKVVYLYETGVLKFLEKRMGTPSDNKLAEIVAKIIGSTKDSAKTALRRLPKGNKAHEMNADNHLSAIGFIRDRKFEMKPLSKINFDNDELD